MAGIYTTVARGTVSQANMKISAADGIAFVDKGYAYESNFSTGEDGWTAGAGAVAGNIDGIGGADDWLRLTVNNTSGEHYVRYIYSFLAGRTYKITITYYIPSGQTSIAKICPLIGGYATEIVGGSKFYGVQDALTTVTLYVRMAATTRANFSVSAATSGDSLTVNDPGGDDVFYIKDVKIEENPLTDKLGHLLRIRDSSGRAIQGYIKAAGTGETRDTNVFASFDFTSGWTPVTSTINDADTFTTTGSGGVTKAGMLTNYALYYVKLSGTTSTTTTLRNSSSTFNFGIMNVANYYRTFAASDNNVTAYIRNADASTTDVSELIAEKVLTPSETGVTIVSTKGGSTFNFALKNSSFNYNDTYYTYEIIQVRQLPVIATHSITAGKALVDATEANALAAPIGVDLSAYQDGRHMLAMYDASGYAAIAHISATAPGGEALGSEFITSVTNSTVAFETLTINANGKDIDQAVNSTSTGLAYTNTTLTLNALYKITANLTINSGSAPRLLTGRGASGDSTNRVLATLSAGAQTIYTTATEAGGNADTSLMVNIQSGSVGDFALVWSAKPMTTPPATGVLLLSRKGGDRGWLYKHASFNPNAAITAKILYVGD